MDAMRRRAPKCSPGPDSLRSPLPAGVVTEQLSSDTTGDIAEKERRPRRLELQGVLALESRA
jgi:hypothetical protein